MPRYFALEQPVPRTIIAAIYDPEGFHPEGAPVIAGQTPSLDGEDQRNFFTSLYAMSVPTNKRLHIEVEDDGAYRGWLIPV